ncbi:cell division protein FtsA [Pseudalkalibacillus salsuginis]|uniref:cell division protein FtsA n=1 Tax=Pseudalkalibacillus salsuginis TaxID=2910972 RepID=UPI001F203EC0|nr:cell division protein FtsA [Pseudalkalibacillus salsuginis]MCF6410476.1 cell division protein FtsA [Pseudalkalibacillus salsuginis]
MNSSEVMISLDIGTSNIKVIIGEMSDESFNVIGVGNAKSEGIKKGSIVDIDETVRSIKKAVEQAERMVGAQINSVIVGITGNHVQLQPCHGVVAVSSEDREIRDEDITRVIDAAQVMSIPPEREIIDVIPREFVVDGLGEINDPRGMIGVRLEMEGILITGSKTILHNVLRCVERAGLDIADICLQPLAAGTVALNKDERNLGVALVDMGAGSTTLTVFDQGSIQFTKVLPIGGDFVTKDISIGLRTTTEDAERVKVKHGHAFIDHASDEESFEVARIGSSNEQQFSQYELAHIIEPRMEEIFGLVMEELHRNGYNELPGGFVLTGGVVAMPGVLELAREVLEQNVRISMPDYIGVREAQYTTGVGLIQFTFKNVKIQGKEVAASISDEQIVEEQPAKKRRNTEQRVEKDKPGVKNKMKEWFGTFFE